MGRKRLYVRDAERKAASRERAKQDSERRNPDVRVPAWELHAFLKDRASEGCFGALEIVGNMPADTLRNVLEYFKLRFPMEFAVLGQLAAPTTATPTPKKPPKTHKKLSDVDLGELPKKSKR